MGRRPCCPKEGLNRGAWTVLEDKVLTDYVRTKGEGKWRDLPKKAGLKRCGKSCRLRWLNYLRPGIKRGNMSHEEEDLIIRLHKLLGNRWSLIAGRLPGRTDNEIKNYWNTNLSKKVQGAASAQKHSNQSEEQKMEKQKKKKTIEPLSHVVRTKASRCNRVVLTPQPKSNQVAENNNEATLSDPEHSKNKAVKSDSYDGLSSFSQVKEENSSNLMFDLDLLNSDLFIFGNGEAGEGGNGNSLESLPSWDQLGLCLEKDVMKDWTGIHGTEPEVSGEAGEGSDGNSHESLLSSDQPVNCLEEDMLKDLFVLCNRAGEGSNGNNHEPLPSWDQPDSPSFTSLLGQVDSWLGE